MDVKSRIDVLLHWEKWHYHVKYIPLYPAWLWYCLRARSLWFFTPSNPTITFGGFEGESKREIYEQLPLHLYPKSIYISPKDSIKDIELLIEENGLHYPIAVKPDVGMMGFMFRKLDNKKDLETYHQTMPCDYIIQELISYPMEVSVFYYRFPGDEKGTITGFLKKELLEVTGDGTSTLEQLINAIPERPGFKLEEWKEKHRLRLNDIIKEGELYRISWVANLSRGGKLISLAHQKDDQLLKVFDDLSHYSKHFYYGRYDIKCNSVEDLKEGKNFSILEYNGSGAEPHHIYGNGNNLWQAYKIILHHWNVLYRISKQNKRNGYAAWSFQKGLQFLKNAKKHFKQLKRLDTATLPA